MNRFFLLEERHRLRPREKNGCFLTGSPTHSPCVLPECAAFVARQYCNEAVALAVRISARCASYRTTSLSLIVHGLDAFGKRLSVSWSLVTVGAIHPYSH